MDEITELLARGVANIIPSRKSLEEQLRSGQKLNIYFGIDPTATRIHLGHSLAIRKLQQFVKLRHQVTFLIGDFTALIGDPSDKDTERPVLSYDQIQLNFQSYQAQARKLLDFSQVTLKFNSEWLKKLTFTDILQLTRHFSLNDFISRELIKKRLSEGKSVSLPEVLYPVMQGYDSYVLDTDLQIGGTDQTFNMQAGRTLQKNLRGKDSFIMSLEFLEGTDGRKMSKSWGNAIWLEDSPNDMYGKVMSLRDELIHRYFLLATNLSQSDIDHLTANTPNPMDLKKRLAWQIVCELHSPDLANSAQTHFESVYQQGHLPQNLPVFTPKTNRLVSILVESGLATSNSDAKRQIQHGAVSFNGQKITDVNHHITTPGTLQLGPRRFINVKALPPNPKTQPSPP